AAIRGAELGTGGGLGASPAEGPARDMSPAEGPARDMSPAEGPARGLSPVDGPARETSPCAARVVAGAGDGSSLCGRPSAEAAGNGSGVNCWTDSASEVASARSPESSVGFGKSLEKIPMFDTGQSREADLDGTSLSRRQKGARALEMQFASTS